MTSTVPDLDTIDFERLVDKARAQIPRYASAWTDHNLHDPGMTLIDLLAWIVDQQIYRVGFVSDRHLRAFAALLGQHPQPPRAATGLVWPDEPLGQPRLVTDGATIRCVRHPEIPFALRGDVFVTVAGLSEVALVVDGVEALIDVTGASAGSVPLAGAAAAGQTSVVFRFNGSLVEPGSTGTISLGFEMDEPPGGAPGEDNAWGPLVFMHRFVQAESVGDWVTVEVLSDSTFGLARTGTVRMDVDGGIGASELLLSLESGFFPVAPQLRHVALNVLEVVQEERNEGAVLATSNGTADQEITFVTEDIVRNVGDEALKILVEEEPAVKGDPWQERDRLDRSGPAAEHYVRYADRLVFGNGINGKRPPRGAQILHGSFARTRGAAGNLRAGLVWSVPALDALGTSYGRNTRAFAGGADATDLAALGAAAREVATSRKVQLTDQDLQQRALQLDGLSIVRAEVLAGFDPRLPNSYVGDVRTLVVFRHREPTIDIAPLTDDYLAVVTARVDVGRVLGERLVVQGPQIVPIHIAVGVIVEPGAALDEVSEAVRSAIDHRLSDIAMDPAVDPWPLGRTVTGEEIKSLAANVVGVRAVPTCAISGPGGSPGTAPVTIAADAIAVAATIVINPRSFGPANEARVS